MGMPRLMGDVLDLMVRRSKKCFRRLDAPVGDEPAHPPPDLLGKKMAEVIGVYAQMPGDAENRQARVGEVCLYVLGCLLNLRMPCGMRS